MRLVALLSLLQACDTSLRCGIGTHQEGAWCVANEHPAASDDDPDDPDDAPAVTPDETGAGDTDAPEDTEAPDDTDAPRTGPPPYFGDILFVDAAGMSAFCAVHDGVYGNIDIRGFTFTDLIALSCLRRVDGSLTIDASSLTSVNLPNLERVRGTLTVAAPRALAITMTNLTSVGGNLLIGGQQRMSVLTLQLGALREVGLDLRVDDTDTLDGVDLPALRTVGRSLWIRRHTTLTRVVAPLVTSLGGALRVEDDAAIRTIDLPGLVSVGDAMTGELAIEDNPALTALDGLGALQRVSGPLVIRGNAALPQATAEALRDRIGQGNIGGVAVIEDNAPP
ncbi:MAG TPA: hypothetical protein PKA64_17655 [Myxococcota bacterium]|nr:hypothetical protein [Myxococcota bacterium]